jgi:elongation factor G
MGVAIGKMVAEDPSFRVETDEESGETILKGMGELHLDIKVDILQADPQASRSRSASRRSPTARPSPAGRRQLHAQEADRWFGSVREDRLHRSSRARGQGFEFESVVGGNVPKEFWPAVEKGFRVSMEQGPLAGFPLLDVKVTLWSTVLPRGGLLGRCLRDRGQGRLPSVHAEGRPRSCSSRS